jgi:DNA polymerase III delta subunit
MLYIYYGTINNALEKSGDMVRALQKKSADAYVLRFSEENIHTLSDMLREQGLFKQQYIISIPATASDAVREEVIARAGELAAAPHVVVVTLGVLSVKEEEALKMVATKMQKCEEELGHKKSAAKKSANNVRERSPFALADALYAKDKKKLFLELAHARAFGARGEEVAGQLFWAIKSIVIASSTATAVEAGMKPYPYDKARRALQVWTPEKARACMVSVALAQSSAYEDGVSVMNALELLVLEL